MKIVYYSGAKEDLFNIFDITEKNWSENQAEYYLNGLYKTINQVALKQKVWRKLPENKIKSITENEIFFVSYKRHFIFFKEMKNKNCIAILRILHDRMNIPKHMRDTIHNINNGEESILL